MPSRIRTSFLPARVSLFPRISLFLALLAYPLFTAGCGPRTVWGLDANELKSSLSQARYEVLSHVDLTRQDPGESLTLAPEAPYYLAFVFDALDRPADGERLREVAWSRSPTPWREEAGLQLARDAVTGKDYDRAASICRQLLGGSGSADIKNRARRVLVEALYWNKDDAGVLREAADLPADDPEVLLFRGVSSLRLGLPAGHDLIMELFLRQRTSALHGRVYTFLEAEPAYLQLFSAVDQEVLTGKYGLVEGTWAKAIASLEKAFNEIDPGAVSDGALVEDLSDGYIHAADFAAGARFMDGLSTHLTGQARVNALEQAGRLSRRARDYESATRQLRLAATVATSPQQRDRISWYQLDILLTQEPADLADRVAADSVGWFDPSYFSDLFDSHIATFVAARKWKTLATLWSALETRGPNDIRAQLSYLLARAWQEGYLARLPGYPSLTARDLFTDAARRDPTGYYGILAASMIDELPDKAIPALGAPASAAPVTFDLIAAGFLAYGLSDKAYARMAGLREGLSDGDLMEAARQFASAGDLRSSLSFVGAEARKRRLTLNELRLFYPRGFPLLLEPLAAGAGIPDHILYGLVREESYFDPDIVSSAGAVGLTQLMPATASQVARGLHLVQPSLRDPTTNLMIGVRHFQDLLARAGSTTKALLAYNAGLARVRQWEKAAPGLPDDIFMETVPIAETRGYVRKILVSSVMYAFLYHDADPRRAALQFFLLQPKLLEPEAVAPGNHPPR